MSTTHGSTREERITDAPHHSKCVVRFEDEANQGSKALKASGSPPPESGSDDQPHVDGGEKVERPAAENRSAVVV